MRPELGVGERLDAPGVAQLERARARGLQTAVLVGDRAFYGDDADWLVDRWVECDTLDPAAIVAAVDELGGVVLAVTSTVDSFLAPTAAAVRALGLRGPTPGTPVLSDDEAVLRAAMADAGVAVAPWVSVCAGEPGLASAVGYPCVVAPVDGSRRWDVALVGDDRELRALATRHGGRSTYGRQVRPRHRLLVEQYVHGPRYAADGFVVEGRPEVLAWSEQVMTLPPEFTELALTATRQAPVGIAPAYVEAALAAAGHDSGPFHLEFVLGPAGPVLVALHARPAAPGAQLCVDHVSGVDTADLAVALLLGEPVPVARPDPAVAACTRMYLMSHHAGRVREVSGVREVAAIPGLVLAEVFTDVGGGIELPGSPAGYLGHVIAAGATPEQARRRAVFALNGIRVDVEVLQTV
ncbi:ATP-grasp domain-containing protein [Blastococcus atacamensis]|uniref:ATP-grasp domain-containing protein n=1 Tax=Blastococcus atacamensis TaxID=2070508 RepID=UPI0018E4AFC4|nr:ATP-grasp domain-containing protein [Blastococcus atacamensis]